MVQRVCMLSSDHLSMVSNSGLLDCLIDETTSEDMLGKLVAMELISDLMLNDNCIDHLCAAGVLKKLDAQLQVYCQSDDQDNLEIPGNLFTAPIFRI